MAAGQNPGGWTRPRGPRPELFHARMFGGIIQVAAKGRAEEVLVAGGIGDNVVAPVVEDTPVRVGKTVGNVGLKFAGARLEAEDAAVVIAHRAIGRLDLGAMEDAVAEING